ncbi:hypothetical protein TSA6c_02600, partial [Azospirillum sp. TSA6c]
MIPHGIDGRGCTTDERQGIAPPMTDDIILEARNLTKEFKGFLAVREVNLQVRRGTIHALIGPNGAGK